MRNIVASIEAEFRRYEALAKAAMDQLDEQQLAAVPAALEGEGANSVATVAWHVGGNLRSRFTDFLTSDGEKPWRDREDEFRRRTPSCAELREHSQRGWTVLFDCLAELSDEQLHETIAIRGVPHSVHAALHRSLAHTSYHVGQIVWLAKALRGPDWQHLSIPPGGSAAYNRAPDHEHGDAHSARLQRRDEPRQR